MRIGFSTSVIQRGRTGVAQYVFALLRAFLPHAKEHEFHLFVFKEDLPLFDFVRDSMRLVVVPEDFRPAVRDVLWHQRKLPGLARELGLELLHVPSYRRMLWSCPCALVATIHDLAPFHVRGKYDWRRMLYARLVVKQLARRQDEIIAVSAHTAHDLERFFGVGSERVTVVWNGIDAARFHPGDRAAAKAEAAQHWKLDRPFFLYISRLEHPGKNHVRLIEAFNRFKAATGSDWLLALGGSDWHGAEIIHATAKASPFAADIRLTGFVADEALPQLYRASEVFVYPSLFEGFGFPPVEAMACGCPVISSERGSLREVVADAAWVIDPEKVEELSLAMTRLACSETDRAKWREAGFRNARRFDWRQNACEVLAVYERAVRRAKRGKPTL
jgi:glycosyltransferase involved in cell wall biosynthesis